MVRRKRIFGIPTNTQEIGLRDLEYLEKNIKIVLSRLFTRNKPGEIVVMK
jgi:hypothetical protein